MDFIDWSHLILEKLVEQRHNPYISDLELGYILYGKDFCGSPQYWESKHRQTIFETIENLVNLGLVNEQSNHWQITRNGRDLYNNPFPTWEYICQRQFDEEEERLLRLVNRLSPQIETDPLCVWLDEVGREHLQNEFGFEIEPRTNEDIDAVQKYLYSIPEILANEQFLQQAPTMGYHNFLKSTYLGLVWETRRGLTSDSRFIDDLVEEWETTNVDFKRELHLNTQDEKGEFAKDILGLVNTKSSGRRFMIIGFDDKTRQYHSAPDPKVTQNRIEQILANLTNPVVTVRYEVIDYRLGKVGKIEIFREAAKLPYRATIDVIGANNKRRLEKDKVYVRHGSQTEAPTTDELKALEEEGQRARDT